MCAEAKAAARLNVQGTLPSPARLILFTGYSVSNEHPTRTATQLQPAVSGWMCNATEFSPFSLPLKPTNFIAVSAHKENAKRQRNKVSALQGVAWFVQFLLISSGDKGLPHLYYRAHIQSLSCQQANRTHPLQDRTRI